MGVGAAPADTITPALFLGIKREQKNRPTATKQDGGGLRWRYGTGVFHVLPPFPPPDAHGGGRLIVVGSPVATFVQEMRSREPPSPTPHPQPRTRTMAGGRPAGRSSSAGTPLLAGRPGVPRPRGPHASPRIAGVSSGSNRPDGDKQNPITSVRPYLRAAGSR